MYIQYINTNIYILKLDTEKFFNSHSYIGCDDLLLVQRIVRFRYIKVKHNSEINSFGGSFAKTASKDQIIWTKKGAKC